MSVVSHLEALRRRHQRLEEQIYDAYTSHTPDCTVTNLKKQKLKVKEAIMALEKQVPKKVLEEAA